jgi:hypothetical protein
MSIIISRGGKNAEKVDQSVFGLEDKLQEYIYDNPETIPLYDIDENTRLFIAAREFSTRSGPIDALGFDSKGNIYVVETKLYKNPDKRTVVAQALDYGASLWRNATDFDEFISQLNVHCEKQFVALFADKYAEFFGLEDVNGNLQSIRNNLADGAIKFVVLMDKLHDALKDLVIFVNQNSKFDLYAVELEYYKYSEFEIVIPKLFGAEVKKEVTSTKVTGGRRKWDEASYWQEVESKLDPAKIKALRKLYDWASANADQIRWGTGAARGSFNPQFIHISSISFISAFSDGSVQVSYGYLPENMELRKRLRDTLSNHITFQEVTGVTDEALKSTYRSLPPEFVASNIDKILVALSEFVKEK